jgi:fatty acid desaturase
VFNHSGYERLAGAGSGEYAKPFRKHLVQSLVGSGLAIALAIVLATVAGRIEWSGSVAWNKVLTTIGGFFGAWGTWFGVTERSESYKKSRLDERLRDVVFIALFVPGVILGAIGALW